MIEKTTSRKLRPWHWAFLLLLIVGTCYIINKTYDRDYKSTGEIFGTFYEVTYQHNEPLDSTILQRLQAVDASLSMFNPNSIVSRINANQDVVVDSLFTEVFNLSQQVSEQTKGNFDVTVAPLVNAWGFGFTTDSLPTSEQIDSLKRFVGSEKVMLHGERLYKQHPAVMLDFSAIAKGYGVDCVARALAQEGVDNYLVNIGGEVVAHGTRPDGKPWRVGIEIPDTIGGAESIAYLQLTNAALATSGNYRRFYYKDGVRYAHTINPRTGRPVNHTLLSATVVAPTCALADAYATAFMVMGAEQAKRFVAMNAQIEAYLVYTTAQDSLSTWASDGMQSLLEP